MSELLVHLDDTPWAGLGLLICSGICRFVVANVSVRSTASTLIRGLLRMADALGTLFWPVLVAALFFTGVARLHYVTSQSMLPGLPDGSIVVAMQLDLGWAIRSDHRVLMLRRIQRGDVVVFRYPLDMRQRYVKRVIGLPGDVVAYDLASGFSINGRPVPSENLGMFLFQETGLLYPHYREVLDTVSYDVLTYDAQHRPAAIETLPGREKMADCHYEPTALHCVLPPGHYFVAGDNRDRSEDSRAWGLVPEGSVTGRVVARLW